MKRIDTKKLATLVEKEDKERLLAAIADMVCHVCFTPRIFFEEWKQWFYSLAAIFEKTVHVPGPESQQNGLEWCGSALKPT